MKKRYILLRPLTYKDQWMERPENVDCHICGGDGSLRDANRDDPKLDVIQAEECCSFTGIDQIPWSELFRSGRSTWNEQDDIR